MAQFIRVIWICLLTAISLARLLSDSYAQTLPKDNDTPDILHLSAVVEPFTKALQFRKEAGEIYYRAVCEQSRMPDKLNFPTSALRSEPVGKSSRDDIRALFDTSVAVMDYPAKKGIVRVEVGNISDPILNTKIRVLRFYPGDEYDVRLVLGELVANVDVQAAIKKLGIRPARAIGIYPVASPRLESPHLPNVLNNITFSDVLDEVARTFNGVVVFGTCNQPPLFGLNFIPLGEEDISD